MKVVVALLIDAVVSNEPVFVGTTFKANDAVVANEAVPCRLPVNPFNEFTEPVKLEGPFTTLNVPYKV